MLVSQKVRNGSSALRVYVFPSPALSGDVEDLGSAAPQGLGAGRGEGQLGRLLH